jgi:hypothetical protein
MSADNGIYILVSPNKETGFTEYRVIYAQSIDNIYFQPDHGDFNTEHLRNYFAKCKFNTSDIDALAYARKLESKYSYLEYGIKWIYMNVDFPKGPLKSKKYKPRKRR